MTIALPLLGEERPERADAAENRRKVLAAAEELFTSCDPATVSMDAVAAKAGVGKGTLFRRFGDRASLARAVLSEHEIELQDALLRGEPPLGPGAPPLERLIAFGEAYVAFLERHGALLRSAEGSHGAFLSSAPYAFYRTHIAVLLREAGLGDSSEYLSDVILGPLGSTSFRYQRALRRRSCRDLVAAHADLCIRLLSSTR